MHSNCLLKHVSERKLESSEGIRGRRCKQLLDDLKKTRRPWNFKDEALDRSVWRTRFLRGCGPLARHTM